MLDHRLTVPGSIAGNFTSRHVTITRCHFAMTTCVYRTANLPAAAPLAANHKSNHPLEMQMTPMAVGHGRHSADPAGQGGTGLVGQCKLPPAKAVSDSDRSIRPGPAPIDGSSWGLEDRRKGCVVSSSGDQTPMLCDSLRQQQRASTVSFGHDYERKNKAVFSSEKIWQMDTVALSFVFDKYYLIMD